MISVAVRLRSARALVKAASVGCEKGRRDICLLAGEEEAQLAGMLAYTQQQGSTAQLCWQAPVRTAKTVPLNSASVLIRPGTCCTDQKFAGNAAMQSDDARGQQWNAGSTTLQIDPLKLRWSRLHSEGQERELGIGRQQPDDVRLRRHSRGRRSRGG